VFVTVDKDQRFKSFISQMTSIRLELSSSNADKLCVSNFQIADYFFKLGYVFSCVTAFGSSAITAYHIVAVILNDLFIGQKVNS